MGSCAGCIRRKIFDGSQPQQELETVPRAIPWRVVHELRDCLSMNIGVRDRMGRYTSGLCYNVWVDEDEEGMDYVQTGNVSLLKTDGTLEMLGFTIILDIDLLDDQPNRQPIQ